MSGHQTKINEYANDAVAALVRDYPDATLTDVVNGLRDAISDAPTVYTATQLSDAAFMAGVERGTP